MRIPEKLLAKVNEEAVVSERTRTEVILTALRKYLK